MDRAIIYKLKMLYMDIYYSKMIDYVIANPEADDPMHDFRGRTNYNIKECIMDIGDAWEQVDKSLIYQCFEKLICPEDYVTQYNWMYNTNEEWPFRIFRGFPTLDLNAVANRDTECREIVERLNRSQEYVNIAPDSVQDEIGNM